VSRGLLLALAALLVSAPAGAGQQPARRPAAQAAQARRDSLRADSVIRVEYRREVFNYQGGPRDPFRTLITTDDVGPSVSELRLVAISFDPRYGNSVAIVRQEGNPRPHRLRRGDSIGRFRVIQIRQYEVVFQIEEFGFERQETLSLPRPEVNR
jgi:hypothetical protein